jgi:DNA-binding transcriptional ArsR family regulator
MDNTGPLNEDHLKRVAFLAKSLSDGNRLRILQMISRGRQSVSAIIDALDLSQPLVSHHLKELKRSLLVKVEREGPFVYYELADLDEDARERFLMGLIGQSEGDRVAGLVHRS